MIESLKVIGVLLVFATALTVIFTTSAWLRTFASPVYSYLPVLVPWLIAVMVIGWQSLRV